MAAKKMNKIITITDTFCNIDDLLEYSENTLDQNFMDKVNTPSSTPIFDVLFRNKDINEKIFKPLSNKYKEELEYISKEMNNIKLLWFHHLKILSNKFYKRYDQVEELIIRYKFQYKKSDYYGGVQFLKDDLKELNWFVNYMKKYEKCSEYKPTIFLKNTSFCSEYYTDYYEFRLFEEKKVIHQRFHSEGKSFKGMMDDVENLNNKFLKKYPKHSIKYDGDFCSDSLRLNRIISQYDYYVDKYLDIINKYILFSNGDTSYNKNIKPRIKQDKKWFYMGEKPKFYHQINIYQNWDYYP